jgi:hypothetical protein
VEWLPRHGGHAAMAAAPPSHSSRRLNIGDVLLTYCSINCPAGSYFLAYSLYVSPHLTAPHREEDGGGL